MGDSVTQRSRELPLLQEEIPKLRGGGCSFREGDSSQDQQPGAVWSLISVRHLPGIPGESQHLTGDGWSQLRQGITPARIRGLLTSRQLHQPPPGSIWPRIVAQRARRSRLSSHTAAPDVLVLLPTTSREGFFLGKSPCLAQHQPRALHSHTSSTELCSFVTRWSLLPHHCSKLLQWLWLRGAKPLVATQSSIQTDAASHSRRVFPCLWSPASLLPICVS